MEEEELSETYLFAGPGIKNDDLTLLSCKEHSGIEFRSCELFRVEYVYFRSRLAAVATSLSQQGVETPIAILLPLSVEGGSARLLALSVREKMLGFGQFAQKVSGLFRRNLSAEEGPEQRTPENGPLFVTIRSIGHAASPWHTFSIVRRGV